MPKKRPYETSHPWITFAVDLRRLPSTFWTLIVRLADGSVRIEFRPLAERQPRQAAER